jgi:3-phenylpropionate/trans-cinnamate dioxygenase ferredoxin reductase subunit
MVTVVETGARLMMRGVPAAIEARMRARHAAAGVDIRLGAEVAAILGDAHVTGVRLGDGSEIAADTVLVAIGVVPRVELARAAGLAVDNGIVVDRTLRTEDPAIFAAGDAEAFAHDLAGRHVRRAWKNAETRPVARNMLGGAEWRARAVDMVDQYA